MQLKYILNKNTGKLHIEGYCPHSKPFSAAIFRTEKEAYNFGGQTVRPCLICQKKRERILREVTE